MTVSTLKTVGISAAKGVRLVAAREQIDGTLPKGESAASVRPTATKELSPAEKRQVETLQQIDRKVREHEAAHLRAGRGVVTSGANFSYTYGPDGKQYAVAGEVSIDTSRERKPEENIDKGKRIQIAALAPADPSPQDRRVAAIGGQLEATGYQELNEQFAREQAERAAEARQRLEQAYESPAPEAGTGVSFYA